MLCIGIYIGGGGEDMEYLRYLGVGLGAMLAMWVVIWSVTTLSDWISKGPRWVQYALSFILLLIVAYVLGWLLTL